MDNRGPNIAVIAYDYKTVVKATFGLEIEISVAVHKIGSALEQKTSRFAIRSYELSRPTTGVSLPIGLYLPQTTTKDRRVNAIFERNLSELLLSHIQGCLEQSYNTVVIQGPMFPKLRGRIGYRHFSVVFDIAALTFAPEWIDRTLGVSTDSFGWSGLYPQLHIDAMHRSFCKQSDANHLYSVEIICQMASPHEPELWLEKQRMFKSILHYFGYLRRGDEKVFIPLIALPAVVAAEISRSPNVESIAFVTQLLSDSLTPAIEFTKRTNGQVSQSAFNDLANFLRSDTRRMSATICPKIESIIRYLSELSSSGKRDAARHSVDAHEALSLVGNLKDRVVREKVWRKLLEYTEDKEGTRK